MSWVLEDLWRELDAKLPEQQSKPTFRTFTIANEVASKVGEKWGLTVQLNFPAGQVDPTPARVGRENVSLLVETGRKKFQGTTEAEVKKQLELLSGKVKFEPPGHGYEGFRVILDKGRIDCLPGGVHLWCRITPSVLEFLDWLFENAYGIHPAVLG